MKSWEGDIPLLFSVWQLCNFFQSPYMIRNSRLHCRCNPQCLVNPAEVVKHKVKGNRIKKVVDLLAESIGKASKPPHAHTHGQILPLNVARWNMFFIGRSGRRVDSCRRVLVLLVFSCFQHTITAQAFQRGLDFKLRHYHPRLGVDSISQWV